MISISLASLLKSIARVLAVLLLDISRTVASLPSICTVNLSSALPSFLSSTIFRGTSIVKVPLSDGDEIMAKRVVLSLSSLYPKAYLLLLL
jgi:hypothetical protein